MCILEKGKDGLQSVIQAGLAVYKHPTDIIKEDLDKVVITTVPFMLGTSAVYPYLILRKDDIYSGEPKFAAKKVGNRLSIRMIGPTIETPISQEDFVKRELSMEFTRCWRVFFKQSMDAFLEGKNI